MQVQEYLRAEAGSAIAETVFVRQLEGSHQKQEVSKCLDVLYDAHIREQLQQLLDTETFRVPTYQVVLAMFQTDQHTGGEILEFIIVAQVCPDKRAQSMRLGYQQHCDSIQVNAGVLR